MSPSQRLDIKQSQSMVMTPQLQQSIKLLQMTSVELVHFLDQELEKNPFLEEADGEPDVSNEEKSSDRADNSAADESTLFESPEASPPQDKPLIEGEEQSDAWDDGTVSSAVYEGSETLSYANVGQGNGSASSISNAPTFDEYTESEKSLREHISDQIFLEIHDPIERMIALYLSEQLDENGYLCIELKEVAERLKCDKKLIEKVIESVQGFDPAGIFARDLSECLALQLKDRNHFDPAIELLLKNLDLVAEGNLKALQKRCDVSEEDVQDMIREVRTLNPKPATGFARDVVQIMQPDVFLRKHSEKGWIVELNSESLPRVLVNRRYYAEVENEVGKNEDGKKFLSEQLQTANWLTKALDQRANTILKVATEIVSQQDDFLKFGIQYLKPLVLTDIAKKIEMHESTVSRVINGKFMATHIGVFELKYFFSSSIASHHGGDDVSSRTVKFIIKELIDNEPDNKPFSDDTLVKMLADKGIKLARRTVTKYREALKIGSSVERRRAKKLSS